MYVFKFTIIHFGGIECGITEINVMEFCITEKTERKRNITEIHVLKLRV
jgi:hypothetical protein